MTDTGLLRKVASTGKPIIMSTGMATIGEIEESVKTLREAGANEVALLKCTSSYPAPPEEMNLRTIPHLAEAFDVVADFRSHARLFRAGRGALRWARELLRNILLCPVIYRDRTRRFRSNRTNLKRWLIRCG